jgi:two-component system, chemotaxis family, protein-glutamate methylesterase/glutaminase
MPITQNPFAKDFPVICVGGSAGGLDAYIRLLTHLPADMGVAIVIVNHITIMPTQLHEILPRYTHMPVDLITERLCIQPDHVFIIPANRDLHILHGEFRLKPISKPRGWPPGAALGRKTGRGHCLWSGWGWSCSPEQHQASRRHYDRTIA